MGWVDQAKEHAALLEAQVAYGKGIGCWLIASFPEFGAHPAAIAAVIRLHWTVGKGKLTVAEHGALIRGAVARWEMEFESQETI